MNVPAKDNEFDAAYEIEATCHAPDLHKVYAEIFRVLKPGGVFASYEWALTDNYDDKNEVGTRVRSRALGLPSCLCHAYYQTTHPHGARVRARRTGPQGAPPGHSAG